MKRVVFFLLSILLVSLSNEAGAAEPKHKIVAKSDSITLHAIERNGLFYDFKLNFQGSEYSRPFWINASNPTYAPEIHYEDINGDKKKELIIILTKGYGTGVLEQEVAVFHVNGQPLREVLVDNPMAIVNKNIKSSLTKNKAVITIGQKSYQIDVKKLKILPDTIFPEINFGSIIKYEIRDNKLYAVLYPQLSPGAFAGSIVIGYEYRDRMYQAKSIIFVSQGDRSHGSF
ncbi:hypothetical protein [Bacillus sp. AG4(2022)]|uniref:hypothetical protein n=1 Tax=Bacillus sp. AG4(2022) TaxID=2962594 RepID=UPI002882481C|nr:hypothetical protein [Bacillus sp. AG4(2022)]MDT0162967.1 hypothetical protein [Bacillus sp. AG4(2022)]